METSASSLVAVARIVKTHGIRGEVVLQSWTDVAGRLEETGHFFLQSQGQVLRALEVETRRVIQGRYVLKFRGIDTLTEAEKLRDKELAIPEEEIGELEKDQYFIHDLIGMSVRLKDGRPVGSVKKILQTGGVDILEVGEKGEILIPFTAEICIEINTEKKEITIDPPEGLLQLNAR